MNSLSRQSNNMSMNASLNSISHNEERISSYHEKMQYLRAIEVKSSENKYTYSPSNQGFISSNNDSK